MGLQDRSLKRPIPTPALPLKGREKFVKEIACALIVMQWNTMS